MNSHKIISLIFFLIVGFSNTLCAKNNLQIKPVKIEAFKDSNVFAMDESGKYQIGQLHGTWSKVYDIQDKGLSLLDLTAVTKSGIYLIGAESQIDTDKSTFFTALIVLIDSKNKLVKEWRHKTNFLHVSEYENQLTLTSFDGVYFLKLDEDITLIKKNDKRKRLSSIRDGQGNLILCHPASPAKNSLFVTGEPGCVKENSWKFNGIWYPSGDDYKSEPVVCGSWLIEPVQKQYKSPITEIIVRDVKTGDLLKTTKIPGSQRFFCLNDSEILLDSGVQAYSLPEMKLNNKYSCNNNEMIISVKITGAKSICLTKSGYLGELINVK